MVLGGGGFIVGSEGCWWVVVGFFWVVGSGRFIWMVWMVVGLFWMVVGGRGLFWAMVDRSW